MADKHPGFLGAGLELSVCDENHILERPAKFLKVGQAIQHDEVRMPQFRELWPA